MRKSEILISALTCALILSLVIMQSVGSGAIEAEVRKTEPYLVNINTATARELMLLRGIGEKTAAQIIEYRERNGGFSTIEELNELGGIGRKRFESIRQYITK